MSELEKIEANSDIGIYKDTNDTVGTVTWEVKKLGDTESWASLDIYSGNMLFSLGQFCPVNILLSWVFYIPKKD